MIALYGRQSADKKDSISVETQIEFDKRELMPDDKYKIYKDRSYSGGNINRPDFKRMMIDVKSGMISKVVVYRLDRISRSILDFASTMEIFDKHKVEFVSCSEKFDTSTPAGRMAVNILIVFAQFERESAQQRITDNYYERGKLGVFLGGNTPFGYDSTYSKIANKRVSILVPNEEKSPIVKQIYDMYANQGISLGGIASYFNENGILIGKKGKCSSNTISRILRNPAYVKADINVYNFLELNGCILVNDATDFDSAKGLVLYGEGDTKFKSLEGYHAAVGLHEGLIQSDIWLKAQYRVYNNKQVANNGTSKNTWLSGISKCGYCGYAMTYKSDTKKGITRKYLRCSGRNNRACTAEMPSWKLEKAENTVFEILKRHVENINIEIDSQKDEKISSLNLKLSTIDKKIDNLVSSLMESNDVSMNYINKAISKLDARKKEINKEILSNPPTTKSIDTKYYIDKWNELDIEKKKKFAQAYIEKIKFYRDNKIEITFK